MSGSLNRFLDRPNPCIRHLIYTHPLREASPVTNQAVSVAGAARQGKESPLRLDVYKISAPLVRIDHKERRMLYKTTNLCVKALARVPLKYKQLLSFKSRDKQVCV